jgi:hypothetical protein
MAKLTNQATSVEYEVPNDTHYQAEVSAWVAGDQRYTDITGTEYVFTPDAHLIPLIGPIAFQMLFKVEELVAIDTAKEANAAIRIFWKLLDDPRTDFVDRNLEPVQTMLRNLEAGGLLAAGRAEEILHGSVT